MKIGCISDTHCQLANVVIPEVDVLVHAGDLTYRGTLGEIVKELDILEKQKQVGRVVLIAGNHDWLAQKQHTLMKQLCEDRNLVYLEDSAVILNGVKFWGSPWQPEFGNWAFNLPRGNELEERWSHIPDDTNVLITHGPPMKTGDLTVGYNGDPREHVGCYDLRQRIGKLKDLKLHVFGHIHAGYGMYQPDPADFVPTNNQPLRTNIAVNASVCNENYDPVNAPLVVEL